MLIYQCTRIAPILKQPKKAVLGSFYLKDLRGRFYSDQNHCQELVLHPQVLTPAQIMSELTSSSSYTNKSNLGACVLCPRYIIYIVMSEDIATLMASYPIS